MMISMIWWPYDVAMMISMISRKRLKIISLNSFSYRLWWSLWYDAIDDCWNHSGWDACLLFSVLSLQLVVSMTRWYVSGWDAFELLCFTQDRLHAGCTVSSWSWMKSTLLQNKIRPRSFDAAMAFFLLIFLRLLYPFFVCFSMLPWRFLW